LQVRLEGNLEVLFSDTVGFIQKLPTQLVAAFRATLEEIAAASVVVHVLDISAPNAAAQCSAVLQVGRLGVGCGIVPAWVGVHARMGMCSDYVSLRMDVLDISAVLQVRV
jgi:GTP-binding protein HflX